MKTKSDNRVLYFLLYGVLSTGLYFALDSLASFMNAEGIIGLPQKIGNLVLGSFKHPIFGNIYLYLFTYLMFSTCAYFKGTANTDFWLVRIVQSLFYGAGWIILGSYFAIMFGLMIIFIAVPTSFLWLPAFALLFFFDLDSDRKSSGSNFNVSATGVSSKGRSSSSKAYSGGSTSSPSSSSSSASSSSYTATPAKVLPVPSLTEDPKFVKSEYERAQRSSEFVRIVREQYNSTCAVSGLRLFDLKGNPEVHVAHIYPKSLNGSDDPRNGICLSRLFHWAFDAGLFVIEDDLSITVNNTILKTPSYEAIVKFHSIKLIHPKDAQFKPHPVFLKARRDLSETL